MGELPKPPDTIVVLVTETEGHCYKGMSYTRTTMDFKEYVKGVLPAEWGNSWHEESLKAGAIAAKMFGWSMYETYGYVWDCNWNQVYRPEWRTDATDKAVDDTWDWILLSNNKIVRTFYDNTYSTCLGRDLDGKCMGQWDSLTDAKEGMNWKEILAKYYKGSTLVEIGKKETDRERLDAVKEIEVYYKRKPIRLYYLYWLY